MIILSYLCIAFVIGFIGFCLGMICAGRVIYQALSKDVESFGAFRLNDKTYKAELIKGDGHAVDSIRPH